MAYAIIIGGGKIGYYLSRSLINRDYEVCLLEKNPAHFARLASELGDVVMNGDGCDPLTLKNAGIQRADLICSPRRATTPTISSFRKWRRAVFRPSRASSRASTTPTTRRSSRSWAFTNGCPARRRC